METVWFHWCFPHMLTLQSIYGLTEGNRSWKFGPSTHNQWMEWLWRDVYRCVAATYHELNPAFGLYLFVLHYVIAYDKSVLRFIHRGLESKPICTEQMWSPRKIWINGVLREAGEGHHIDYTWLYPRWPKQLWNWSCARSSTESIQNDQQRVTQMYLGRA